MDVEKYFSQRVMNCNTEMVYPTADFYVLFSHDILEKKFNHII